MTKQVSPTVQRRIIAAELRRRRQAAGFTQSEVEQALGLGRNALYRYESGESTMLPPVAKGIFAHYGASEEEIERLLPLVRDARSNRKKDLVSPKPANTTTALPGVPPSMGEFLVLERDASQLYELALTVIPGRLQTEGYARAVLEAGILGADVDELLRVRMERTAEVEQATTPSYWAILRESVLRHPVGGSAVMREQLLHLAEVAKRPHVTLQVLPTDAGAHHSMSSSFVLFRFDVAPAYGVVYIEYMTGGLYRDDPDEATTFESSYRHLTKSALSERASLRLINDIAAKDYQP